MTQTLRWSRIVDLSHPLRPGAESRKFQARQIFAEEVAPVKRLPDQWYVMHELTLVNHIGTHIEVPYHLLKHGADLSEFPVERMVSDALVLDVGNPPPGHTISLGEIRAAAAAAGGGVRSGDMVFVRTGWDREYGDSAYLESPCLDVAAIDWLADNGMSLIGIDSAGVENLASTEHECHLALFRRGIPLIENLTRLDEIDRARCTAIVNPIAVHGVEAIPVRVLALVD